MSAYWLAQLTTEKLLLLVVLLSRIGGLLAVAPGLAQQAVPVRVRALLAVMLTVVITPVCWNTPLPAVNGPVDYLLLVGSEMLVGIVLGTGLAVLFSGVQLAGELGGRVSGLMIADVFDPLTGESVPVFSQFYYLTCLAVFFLVGGHRTVLSGLLESFKTLPLGSFPQLDETAARLVLLTQGSFMMAIRAAAPVFVALVLATIMLGLLNRTLPQLNILVVGFAFNSMLGLLVIALALAAAAWVFQNDLEMTLHQLFDLLGVTAHLPLGS